MKPAVPDPDDFGNCKFCGRFAVGEVVTVSTWPVSSRTDNGRGAVDESTHIIFSPVCEACLRKVRNKKLDVTL